MYVCLCNGFTDGEVRRTAAAADGTIADIYRALGVRPKCGKCVAMVVEIARGVDVAGLTGRLAPV
jgi:bacterioferritin-associated ferredoxin